MSLSANERDEGESLRQRIEALLASSDTQAVIALVVALETRAEAEASRAKVAVEEADALGERCRKLEYLTKHLQRLLYGRRSEKLTHEELDQLCLALGGEGGDETPTPAAPDEREEAAPSSEAGGFTKKPKKRRPNHKEAP